LSVSDKFKDEERPSTYGYHSGYNKPLSIALQLERLHQLFPGLGTDFAEEVGNLPLPVKAEGMFIIPRWGRIAPTHNEAVQIALNLLEKTRDGAFYNYRAGQIGPEWHRQSVRAQQFWETLGNKQGENGFIVFPAQFGLNHRGRSVRRAREVMPGGEFGLGAWATIVMLLTHPNRLAHFDDLWIDCPGDEYDDPDDGGRFAQSPYLGFGGGKVKFGARDNCGSASGFLLQ
jgi:hypothetical protein